MRIIDRALGIAHIQGQPQTRRCECDRPVPILKQEPGSFSDTTEQVAYCMKCGHRTDP